MKLIEDWVKPYWLIYCIFLILFATIINTTRPPMYQQGIATVTVNDGNIIPYPGVVRVHDGDHLHFARMIYSKSLITTEVQRTFTGPISLQFPVQVTQLIPGYNPVSYDMIVPNALVPGVYKYTLQVFYQLPPFFNLSTYFPGFTIVVLPQGVN